MSILIIDKGNNKTYFVDEEFELYFRGEKVKVKDLQDDKYEVFIVITYKNKAIRIYHKKRANIKRKERNKIKESEIK